MTSDVGVAVAAGVNCSVSDDDVSRLGASAKFEANGRHVSAKLVTLYSRIQLPMTPKRRQQQQGAPALHSTPLIGQPLFVAAYT